MELVKDYLKYGFDNKIKEDMLQVNELTSENIEDIPQYCILHNTTYALLSTTRNCMNCMHLCKCCLSIFQLFGNIELNMRESNNFLLNTKVVDNCCHKAKLFLAHKIRVANQQIAIAAIIDDLNNKCTLDDTAIEA